MRYNSGKELSDKAIKSLFRILKENGKCDYIRQEACYSCPFFQTREGHSQFGSGPGDKEYYQNKINRARELLSTM